MEIEKLTFNKIGVPASRSTEHSVNHRLVKISIPRVRWLEVDGPYVPAWAIQQVEDTEKNPEPQIRIRERPRTDHNGKRLKRVNVLKPLTPLEKSVGELYLQGIESRVIAKRLGISFGSAKDANYRYRLKTGLIPQPE